MSTTASRHGQFDDYVIDFAAERLLMGQRVALVTLVAIDGSSPRPLGAQMAVSETGDWTGYLSGGCVERAVVTEALDVLSAGQDRRVRYGKGSKYIDIQLPCGSAIELYFHVDFAPEAILSVSKNLQDRCSTSISIPSELNGKSITRVYTPARRLIVAGLGPAAVQLAMVASISGFETELHSPDQPTLAAVVNEKIRIHTLSIGRTPDFKADERTAFAFMFHDHEWERDLIPAALASGAFYIGALGSFRTHIKRIESLSALGFDRNVLDRISGPAGLLPARKSASDIAVSILAEIMQADAALQRPLISSEHINGSHQVD
ncbi:XdhC family protein [Agrobacterium sp. NPDC058088]|uniref:XdhC family protein n=1 Tax=Agrobacterium sp. NPDC058088 TaxID=3346335 RepID=UPI0036D7DC37